MLDRGCNSGIRLLDNIDLLGWRLKYPEIRSIEVPTWQNGHQFPAACAEIFK
jgi:hypothetical protein